MVKGLVEDVPFVGDARGIEASPCTDALIKGNVAEEAHPYGGGGSVSDAHLTKTKEVGTFGVGGID